jgi:hypothetical protein
MLDLLTKDEDKVAADLGWGLYHVYDANVSQWIIRILPADAAEKVVGMARANNPVAIKALRLMTNYRGK